MIVDKLENIELYKGLSDAVVKGLELLKDASIAEKENGTYEVDGENLYYMIQRYPTKNKEDALFEAHKEHVDIQAIIDGEETIGYALTETLGQVVQPYKPDVTKYADPPVFTEVKLAKGMFTILYPDDAHKPCYDYRNGKSNVHKLVIKVKI